MRRNECGNCRVETIKYLTTLSCLELTQAHSSDMYVCFETIELLALNVCKKTVFML